MFRSCCRLFLFSQLFIVLQLYFKTFTKAEINIIDSLEPDEDFDRFQRSVELDWSDQEEDEFTNKRSKRFIEEKALASARKVKPLNWLEYRKKIEDISGHKITPEWHFESLNFQNRMREWHSAKTLLLDMKLVFEAHEACKAVVNSKHNTREKNGVLPKPNFNGKLKPGMSEYAQRAKEGGSALTLFHLDGSFAPSKWYDESLDYNWTKNQYDEKTKHFTQLIWKDTAKIGCARRVLSGKKDPRPWLVIICKYDPPGNIKTKKAFWKNIQASSENAEPE